MPNSDDQVKKEIFERVSLVKNSLLSAHYQNRWTVVGLKQIINRLFMLLQKRCAIVVLEKTPENNYRVIHHTCLDPYWKKDFENYISKVLAKNKINDNEDFIIINKNLPVKTFNGKETKIENCLIEFYRNKYFMIHKIESPKDRDLTAQDERKFPPLRIDGSDSLSSLTKEFHLSLKNEKMKSFFKDSKINRYMIGKQSQWNSKKTIAIDCPINEGWEYVSDSFFDNHYEKLTTIFDREYRKIQDSPLLTNKDKSPNIFFFVKVFSQNKYRFHDKNNKNGAYPHGLRMIIPEEQKIDLTRAFNILKTSPKKELRSLQGEYLDDAFFWKMLETKNSIDQILKILESPYEDNERSMSDSIFETGYVNIKETPIAFSGTNRLEEGDLNDLDSTGYKRLVCFHYFLMVIAPQSVENSSDLSALLVPGHVGGSPFFCMGFVFPQTAEYKHTRWLDNYHFYHSVCHYLIRGARHKIRSLYLDEIHNIYINNQDNMIDIFIKDIDFNPGDVLDALNPRFKALSRLFPFEYIELKEIRENTHENLSKNNHHRYLNGSFLMSINTHKNPYFKDHLEGQFLEIEHIKDHLLEADNKLKNKIINAIKLHKDKK